MATEEPWSVYAHGRRYVVRRWSGNKGLVAIFTEHGEARRFAREANAETEETGAARDGAVNGTVEAASVGRP